MTKLSSVSPNQSYRSQEHAWCQHFAGCSGESDGRSEHGSHPTVESVRVGDIAEIRDCHRDGVRVRESPKLSAAQNCRYSRQALRVRHPKAFPEESRDNEYSPPAAATLQHPAVIKANDYAGIYSRYCSEAPALTRQSMS